MRQKSKSLTSGAEQTVRDIRRRTRKQYSAEENIAEQCRREGIAERLYHSSSKEFLEAGKKRLSGDTARQASSGEVKALLAEARSLKEALAEQMLENRLLKKHERVAHTFVIRLSHQSARPRRAQFLCNRARNDREQDGKITVSKSALFCLKAMKQADN